MKEGGTALKKLVEYLETQRARYRGLEDAGDKLTALKARGLLLDTVHHLEIARNLLSVVQREESTVWTWQRQLRSYKTVSSYIFSFLFRKIVNHFPYFYFSFNNFIKAICYLLVKREFKSCNN